MSKLPHPAFMLTDCGDTMLDGDFRSGQFELSVLIALFLRNFSDDPEHFTFEFSLTLKGYFFDSLKGLPEGIPTDFTTTNSSHLELLLPLQDGFDPAKVDAGKIRIR